MSTYLTDDELKRSKELLDRIQKIFSERVVGQENLRETLIVGLLAQGHILMESVPGLAKTTAAQTIAQAISGSFHRIQCTPDLMPNDIVGTRIWNQAENEMTTELGPVHANIVLLDEINRSSAKTQSAMLEAMQEGQTTIGGIVYPLPKPFMVMATQNPIEEEGTYVLPEAQMDRFLMKEIITYPKPLEELEVLNRIEAGTMDKPIDAEPISLEDLTFLQQMTRRVFLHDTLKAYIVDIITQGNGKFIAKTKAISALVIDEQGFANPEGDGEACRTKPHRFTGIGRRLRQGSCVVLDEFAMSQAFSGQGPVLEKLNERITVRSR